MWRLYVGGLCTGFAIGGAVCWLAVLSIVPESTRSNFLINPLFPWAALLAFVLAGETLRVRARRIADPNVSNAARELGGSAEPPAAADRRGM